MQGVLLSAGLVSALTLLTNLLGFARELLFARAFGASQEADCFVAAFAMVATCFLVLTGGSLQGAFMPRYQQAIVRGQHAVAKGLWRAALLGTILCSGGLGVGVFVGAEYVVSWVVPGFDMPARVLTAQILQWLAPMILFFSLGALYQSILHAHRAFLAPALIPVGNNLLLVFVLIVLVPSYGLSAMSFGTVGGATLWLLLIPSVLRCLPSGAANVAGDRVRELLVALLPLVVLLGVDQISGLVQKTLVSDLEVGSIAVLNYAARLQGLPVGIFAGALAAVLFPALVEVAARNDKNALAERFNFGVAAISFLLLPTAAFLIAESDLLVKVLLERGSFGPEATARTADALQLYSIGLLSQGLIVYLNRVYFAMGDTRTPMIVGVITAVFHILFCWIAVFSIGYLGIAIGTTFYAVVYSLMLIWRLKLSIPGPIRLVAKAAWRPLVASLVMFTVSCLFEFSPSPAGFGVAISVCGAVYILAALLLGEPTLVTLTARLMRIKGRLKR